MSWEGSERVEQEMTLIGSLIDAASASKAQ